MTSHRRHRGLCPEDKDIFSPKWIPKLREATADLCFLLSRGYAERVALKTVGDHYQLHARQRMAINRAACGKCSETTRKSKLVSSSNLRDAVVEIDGFNALITLETFFSGGVVIKCRDNCFRDLSSVHRTYECVNETASAIRELTNLLCLWGVRKTIWYFDRPVSNSGRLCKMVLEFGKQVSLNTESFVVDNPDRILCLSSHPVVTSDGWILDQTCAWTNIIAHLIQERPIQEGIVVDLSCIMNTPY